MRRALLLAFCPLAACAANAPHGVRPLRPLELATAPYQEATGTSLTGSLLYESGCLLFRDDATKARLLPVWPTGSIFNGTALIFHQPGKADQPVMIGEEFLLLNGNSSVLASRSSPGAVPYLRFSIPSVSYVPRSCAAPAVQV